MVVDLKQVGEKYDEFRTGDTLVRAAYDDGYWSLCEYISIQVNIFSKKERQHEGRLSSYCSKIFVLVHFQFLSLLVNIVHFSVHLLEKFFGYNFMARIHRCITRSLISSVRPTFHH